MTLEEQGHYSGTGIGSKSVPKACLILLRSCPCAASACVGGNHLVEASPCYVLWALPISEADMPYGEANRPLQFGFGWNTLE